MLIDELLKNYSRKWWVVSQILASKQIHVVYEFGSHIPGNCSNKHTVRKCSRDGGYKFFNLQDLNMKTSAGGKGPYASQIWSSREECQGTPGDFRY